MIHKKTSMINLLVVPASYPEDEQDLKGIFIKDYVTSVKPFCNVTVFSWSFSSDKRGLKKNNEFGIDIFRLYLKKRNGKIGKTLQYIDWFIKSKRFLLKSKNNYNLIHTHSGTIPGVLTTLISKWTRIPNIITEHTGPFSKISKNIISYALCKYSMKNSYAVLPVSNDLKEQIIASGINSNNFVVLHNPVDTELFNIDKNIKKDKVILFAGRLEAYKGALRTVIAFEKIINDFPDYILKIIGDGPELKTIRDYIGKNKELDKKVILFGGTTKKIISEEMKKSSFFIFPSEHETFGLVVAEAMASGLPVITANTTSFPEYVTPECGILINPSDVNEISKSMSDIILSIDDYNAEYIRTQIVDRFSFEVFGQKLMELYNKCTK